MVSTLNPFFENYSCDYNANMRNEQEVFLRKEPEAFRRKEPEIFSRKESELTARKGCTDMQNKDVFMVNCR